MLLKIYVIWIGIASMLCAFAFWIDKRAATRGRRRRIPEIVLLTLLSFGGSLGGLFGMFCIGHKRNIRTKFHFRFAAILSCIIQLGILTVLLLWQGGIL